ncbi:MAG: hypothetical protein WC708_11285 [Lentisphaeria bacterium]
MDAEADAVCRATRYERSAERVDTRSGHYERPPLRRPGPGMPAQLFMNLNRR